MSGEGSRTDGYDRARPSDPERALRMERHIALWFDLMEVCNEFLLAGLRRKYSNEADVIAAYRAWYARQMDAHDQMMLHMMREFQRRGTGHGA